MAEDNGLIRLNKFLALALGLSRRQADDLISQKKVTINQLTARLGDKVKPSDIIKCSGQLVNHDRLYLYLVINKPVGYVCSRRQQGSSPTIYELIPAQYHNLKTVGRLDKDSSGIVLLTNNGDLAHQMMHPNFMKIKIYEVELDKDLEPIHRQMVSDYGISLDDGTSRFQVNRVHETDNKKWQIIMNEGRNRQIRRTFKALGYEVIKLHRHQFGNLKLDNIKFGEWRLIDIK